MIIFLPEITPRPTRRKARAGLFVSDTRPFLRGRRGWWVIKAIQVELPDKLAAEIEAHVKTEWFGSEAEVIRAAVLDFVRRNRVDLLEGFMRQDIQWALSQSDPSSMRGGCP